MGINTITVIRPQRYHIPITLIIDKNYIVHTIALFDTSEDENYIIKGLIPHKCLDKGIIRLFSAIGKKHKINFKLRNAYICNKEIGFLNNFKITKDINKE